jgi:hypothetical protein
MLVPMQVMDLLPALSSLQLTQADCIMTFMEESPKTFEVGCALCVVGLGVHRHAQRSLPALNRPRLKPAVIHRHMCKLHLAQGHPCTQHVCRCQQ